MAYEKEYDKMSLTSLIDVCDAEGISYEEGGRVLSADEIRAKLGKVKGTEKKPKK